MEEKDDILNEVTNGEYKYGFVTDIDTETIPKGLSEEVVRMISAKKGEPEWMTEFRLKAYRHWLTMTMPRWPHLDLPEIDFQDIIYYAAPKQKPKLSSMDEVDPELKATFDKLGVPLEEQMLMAGVAVDAVMDSVSVKTTFRETLAEKGIIFCSFSEALRDYPELVRKYMCSVVPYTDNFFAALNTAVFSDGSFCYVPKGVRCPMELSTYFRINAAGTGQFERTLTRVRSRPVRLRVRTVWPSTTSCSASRRNSATRLSTATRRSTASNSDFEGPDSPVTSGFRAKPEPDYKRKDRTYCPVFFLCGACGRSGDDRGQASIGFGMKPGSA